VQYNIFYGLFCKLQSAAVISMSFLLSYAFCYKIPSQSVLFRFNPVHVSQTLLRRLQCSVRIERGFCFSVIKIIVLLSIGSVFAVIPFCSYSCSSLCWSDSGLTAVSVRLSITETCFKLFITTSHYTFSYFTSSSSIKFLPKPYTYNRIQSSIG
jgi:hypothetical protein